MISVHQIQENRTSIDFEQSISSLMSRKLRKFLIQFMLDKILIHTKIDKKKYLKYACMESHSQVKMLHILLFLMQHYYETQIVLQER